MLGTKSQRKGPVSLVSIAVNSSSKQLVNSKKNNYRSVSANTSLESQKKEPGPWGKA